MRRILAAWAWALAGGAALSAAEPDELVRRLADPSFAVRTAAKKELLKLGGAALPAVRAARETTDLPALRERAESLLPRLERLAESEQVLAPKPIAVDYRGIPLTQAIEDLKGKTGIPLLLVPDRVAQPLRPVTLVGEFAPWVAVDKLCEVAGLKEDHPAELPLPKNAQPRNPPINQSSLLNYRSPGRPPLIYTHSTAPILLVDGKDSPLPGSRTSNIRVLLLPATHSANRIIRGTGTVVFHLDVAPLSGLNWSGATTVRIVHAEEVDGRPIFADQRAPANGRVQNPYAAMQWRGGGMWINEVAQNPSSNVSVAYNPRLTPVILRTDDRAIKTLRRLEGVVVGNVRRPNEPIVVVDDLSTAVGKAFDGPTGLKLTVLGRSANADQSVMVSVRVEMPQSWMLQGAANGVIQNDLNIGNIQNQLAFYDANGTRCQVPQQRRTSYSASNWTQTYEADLYFRPTNIPIAGAGPPVKLVLTGTKYSTIEIPFSLENVRLP